MLYFQDNLIHIQTNSDQLSSKKTPTHIEVPNTFLDDGDSPCIYDIAAMVRTTTENNLKTLIAKRLGVEILPYVPWDCSAESLSINDKNIDHQLSSIYDEDWGLWSRKDRSKLTHEQIQFQWNNIHKSGFSISEISRQYKLAPSTLYKTQKLRKQSMLILPRMKF